MSGTDGAGAGPVLPVADRQPARRDDPHGAVQLGVRAPHRRHLRVPHRGHRLRARHRGQLHPAARVAALARPGLGRGTRGRRPVRAVPAEPAARRSTPTSRRGCSRRARVRVVLHPGGGRPRAGWPRARTPSSATTTPTATPTPEQRAELRRAGTAARAALRMPDRDWHWDDLVRGPLEFGHEHVPDFVIVRGNGEPLYTLVNPVDDALMRITHVLRGEDLLSSTPRQLVMYEALHAIGVGRADAAVRAPAVRHGRGQQEAVQARPGVVARALPRARVPARGAAELPGAAGLVDGRGPRGVLADRDGRRVRPGRVQREPGPVRHQEGRGDQRRAPARPRPRRPGRRGWCRTCRPRACSPPSRRRHSWRSCERPRRWSRSG